MTTSRTAVALAITLGIERASITIDGQLVVDRAVSTIALPGPEPTTACKLGKGLTSIGYQLGWVAIALLLVL